MISDSPCKRCSTMYCYKNCKMYSEWEEEAEKAMELFLPKKPEDVTYDSGYLEFWNCPNCRIQHSVWINEEEWRFAHCPNCGQLIDWSDIE